ncbi:MAG: SNF2-related protein [Longimicrobiales bacterium]
MGRGRKRLPVLICPPAVAPQWKTELLGAAESVEVLSHGSLSRRRSARFADAEVSLRKTQLLCVDEAHNFLNRTSKRSRVLYGTVADEVVLFTATPINRGARDLLSVVELLGADNFGDDVLEVVGRLASQRRRKDPVRPLQRKEADRIRASLQEFVVRRTKSDFNRMIDREPEAYTNALGNRCRYPEHDAKVFRREDPPEDCGRALAIREKAKNLRGLINFQRPLRMPISFRWEGMTEERYLDLRIGGGAALAAYQVRSRLRSSKVALVEHLRGTREASLQFGIEGAKPTSSGNVIATLERIAGKPPTIELEVEVPPWLADPAEHRRAVEEEIETYLGILQQVERMTDHRSEANADYLVALLAAHPRILAFDSHLISLYDLQRRIEARGANVVLATGEGGMGSRRAFTRTFALDSEEEAVIGLCSDALAEGLNLQGASALVHLDLPSVIRVLEQRIGRLDRMDSPHAHVEVHWPQEPKNFQLRADERLFWRLREVDDLLGSNVPIPDGFDTYRADQGDFLDVGEIIQAVEREATEDAEVTLADAFARVRALVHGSDAVIHPAVYEGILASKARVLSSVAVVPTDGHPWAFLAVGSADRSAPRWVMVEAGEPPEVVGSLDRVAEIVRERVGADPVDVAFDTTAAGVLEHAIQLAEEHREELLPRRKRVALDELRHVLGSYYREASGADSEERKRLLRQILDMLERSEREYTVDVGQLADWWLELIRPEWQKHVARRGISRPARLRHLRNALKNAPVPTDRLATVRELTLTIEPLDRRVVAAIVGVGSEGADSPG